MYKGNYEDSIDSCNSTHRDVEGGRTRVKVTTIRYLNHMLYETVKVGF